MAGLGRDNRGGNGSNSEHVECILRGSVQLSALDELLGRLAYLCGTFGTDKDSTSTCTLESVYSGTSWKSSQRSVAPLLLRVRSRQRGSAQDHEIAYTGPVSCRKSEKVATRRCTVVPTTSSASKLIESLGFSLDHAFFRKGWTFAWNRHVFISVVQLHRATLPQGSQPCMIGAPLDSRQYLVEVTGMTTAQRNVATVGAEMMEIGEQLKPLVLLTTTW
eukprot:m.168742 g.168742  ORF g.168742 m.168742 type:complete len:219 (-) comp18220_c0_seq2:386-1042(-)